MNDYAKYLLRTELQRDDFRRKYATYISAEEGNYLKWIQGWPLMEWTDYLYGVPLANVPVLIGMMCLLHCSGRTRITFHDSMLKARREPVTDEEMKEWMGTWKPRGKKPCKR